MGEEAEPGSWLSGLGQGGAAARPLDGGVLDHLLGSTRAGEGAGDGAMVAACSRSVSSRWLRVR